MNKLKLRFLWLGAVFILGALPVRAETVSQFFDRLQSSRLWIDTVRYPDSVKIDLLNLELRRLAYEDLIYEKTVIIPLDSAYFTWTLPTNCFGVAAVILNGNPGEASTSRRIKALTYVAPADIGQKFTYAKGRPGQFTVWADSIRLDQVTENGSDTITVRYWADPDSISTINQTLPIRNKYRSILFDRMVDACQKRLIFPNMPNEPNAVTQSLTPAGRQTEVNK